jgi:hypothetical protein
MMSVWTWHGRQYLYISLTIHPPSPTGRAKQDNGKVAVRMNLVTARHLQQYLTLLTRLATRKGCRTNLVDTAAKSSSAVLGEQTGRSSVGAMWEL